MIAAACAPTHAIEGPAAAGPIGRYPLRPAAPGPVLAYDMPEHDMTMKLETASSIYSINTVEAWAVVFTLFNRF